MNAGADGALGGRRIRVTGISQGVGFRPFVYRLTSEEGLTGSVRNDPAGVTIEAFGSPDALDRFVTRLAAQSPRAARLERVQATAVAFERRPRFEIAASGGGAGRQVSIPPDIATCAACRAEILDASNRRYRYAFTNCTNCGPRYTITCERAGC